MSLVANLNKVRQLQKLQADRQPKPIPKTATRETAREEAAKSGLTAPIFPQYFNDPIGFADMLGIRLWKKQRQILLAIATGKKVAVSSGQKTGKSNVFVVAALWWAGTRPRARVLFTAPINKTIKEVLWKELRRICQLLARDGRRICDVLGAQPAKMASTGMQWPDGREIIGYAADIPENMQGFSGPECLTLIDEGSGVDNDIFEAIEGNTMGGGFIAAAGNPTQQSGWFFDAFHGKREFWERIEISSEETPNCTGEEPPIPGLANPDMLANWRVEYGVESARYQIRVLGKFAGTAANAIIGLGDIDAARARWDSRETEPTEPLELGVDVARFGDDDSAITARRGYYAYPAKTVNGFDTVAVVGLVMEIVRKMRRDQDEIVLVKVDTSGGHGGGVADLLRSEHDKEVEVVDVNSSERSDDEEKYVNIRTQLHFAVAEWLRDGGELPDDPRLEAECLSPTYSYDARARMKVESKDDIKKRLKRSPDLFVSLALGIYCAGGPVEAWIVEGSVSRWGDELGLG